MDLGIDSYSLKQGRSEIINQEGIECIEACIEKSQFKSFTFFLIVIY